MNSEILIYQNQSGDIKIDVRLEEETVWLTHRWDNYLEKINAPLVSTLVMCLKRVSWTPFQLS